MITKSGAVNLNEDEVMEAASDGRIWMNIGFGPNVASTKLTYGTDPEDGRNDRRFTLLTSQLINKNLMGGSLKLVHYGTTVYRVRPGRGVTG